MHPSGEAPGWIHPNRGSSSVSGRAPPRFIGASPEEDRHGPGGKRRDPRVGSDLARCEPGLGSLVGILAGG